MSNDSPYQMTLSLNVLNHLGLKLYSNVPQVLSEAVANSWDADAHDVWVDINPIDDVIKIEDNGMGMNEGDVNNRYLTVGYRRREDEDREDAKTTPEGRPVMGRKGIGKLSLFSIARTVEVFTTKDGERHAFRMEVDKIREAIEAEEDDDDEASRGTYGPEEIGELYPDDLTQGTRIVLKDLKKRVHTAEEPLRKRIARRFGVMFSDWEFDVYINDDRVRLSDRDYFHKLQFLWTYGDEDEAQDRYVDACTNIENHEHVGEGRTPDGNQVEGWIGTAEVPKDLDVSYPGTDETDDLNKISLLVRGKMAKADLMDDFNEGQLYTNYLVGELHADFLDQDGKPDIATSDREGIQREDERYQDLLDFLHKQLREIGAEWRELRTEQGSEKAREIPVIDRWYDRLSEQNQAKAKRLLGKINQIATDDEEEKQDLFKFGILAFERLRHKEALNRLDQVTVDNLQAASEVFVEVEDIEAVLYHEIVSQRLEVIRKLDEAVQENALEEVIQEHLFDHLWLLDPSWERATDSKLMEQQVQTEFEDVTTGLPDEVKEGRFDIKYRMAVGTHVIIELKRPDRAVAMGELIDQVDKYRDALRMILDDRGRGNEDIEVVVIVGRKLKGWDGVPKKEQQQRRTLRDNGIRLRMYGELLENASQAYTEYMEREEEAGELQEILEELRDTDLLDTE